VVEMKRVGARIKPTNVPALATNSDASGFAIHLGIGLVVEICLVRCLADVETNRRW